MLPLLKGPGDLILLLIREGGEDISGPMCDVINVSNFSTGSRFQTTVTETLRSFLRTHRDKMIDTGDKDVIQELLVPIQNVVSPNYYV